jgi:hypothetical protein
MWISALAARRVRARTIEVYLSALNSLHSELGVSSTFRSDSQVKRVLEGIKRSFGTEPARPPRLPVTPRILRAVDQLLNRDDPDHRMLRAAMWSACVGMMRPGEVGVENAKKPERLLTVSSLTTVSSEPLRYSLRLMESKT